MQKLSKKVLTVFLLYPAVCVSAEASIYLKAGVGAMKYNSFKDYGGTDLYEKKAPKTESVYDIGIGYNFTNAIRGDLNIYYGKVDYDTSGQRQKIDTMAVFVNGYYDFIFINKTLVLYLTAGVGVGQNDAGSVIQLAVKPPHLCGGYKAKTHAGVF